MLAPAGAPTSENVSVSGGRSGSVAMAVNVYGASSGIVALAGTPAIAGARFTSVTCTTTVWESASAGVPSSNTRTVTLWSAGPSASPGVQEKAPVPGSMLAPAGAPAPSENVSPCAGRFASVAVAVNVSAVPSASVCSPIAASAGATFTSRISNAAALVALVALPEASNAVTRTRAVEERVSGTTHEKLPELAMFAATAEGQVAPLSVEYSIRTESTPAASVAVQVTAWLVPIVHTSPPSGEVTSTTGNVLSIVTEAAGAATSDSGRFEQSRILRLSTETRPVPEGRALFTAMLNSVPVAPVGPHAAPRITPSTAYVLPPRWRGWKTVEPSALRNVASVMLARPLLSSSPGESVNVTL